MAPPNERSSDRRRAGTPVPRPDRRGVARFVIPPCPPTSRSLLAAMAWILAGTARRRSTCRATTLVELDAVASTLALIGGIGCILRWRLDGIARGWWCGWALLAIGVGQLVLEPVRGTGRDRHRARDVHPRHGAVRPRDLRPRGRHHHPPAHDARRRRRRHRRRRGPALAVGDSHHRAEIAFGVIGVAWMLVALGAAIQYRRGYHDTEAGWIIPVAVALGLAELVPIVVDGASNGLVADRWFELAAMAMAAVGAIGGLVRAAVHHRTRALRERIEYEREVANRRRGRRVLRRPAPRDALDRRRDRGRRRHAPRRRGPTTESTLRAALIAEIRRLRTLVNESPAATGVEAFDVALTIAPTIEVQRGQRPGRRRSAATAADRARPPDRRSPRSCTGCWRTRRSTRPAPRSG